MFKLESYITPLLMGYIDKYVFLRQEDFQLSLWGGDAVLNKLDLRLDVFEEALHLPIVFKSGHIHELRLHVPWTALGSEPVVVTINTIEFIVKLRDTESESASSTKSPGSAQSQKSSLSKSRSRSQIADELPPGYLQGLMNRILHNINLVVNNLILKFVEDDIVLSVNVKSAECYSVKQDWARAFVDLTLPELVLRRVLDINDLTVCLDKRNASGKIETYQDPLLYRCSASCRIHMTYDSLYAKIPSVTKFNFLCDKLDISLTETQTPMFFRLTELCMALYYGSLEMPKTEEDQNHKDNTDAFPKEPHGFEFVSDKLHEHEEEAGENSQGWASWAWSYVPQVLPASDEYYEDEQISASKASEAILVIGCYIQKTSIAFKLNEPVGDYYNKMNFKPCMTWYAEGISLQAIMKGISFFNVEFGVAGTYIESQGQSISGTKDLDNTYRESCFLRSGKLGVCEADNGFIAESLFDPTGPENLCQRAKFIFDYDKHIEVHSEAYALNKYGALWMDYVFTMEDADIKPGSSRSSASGVSTDDAVGREYSSIRFLVGQTNLVVSSSMVQRLHKFIFCVNNHEYEPYSTPMSETMEEPRSPPTEEEVSKLEEFTPTRTYHLTLIQPVITVLSADLPRWDVTQKRPAQRKGKKHSSKSSSKKAPEIIGLTSKPPILPAVVLQTERCDFQITVPMYPRKLVRLVSTLATHSGTLLHHCHSHTYFKVFGMQLCVSALRGSGEMEPLHVLLPPSSAVYYYKQLLLPMYWKNPLQPKDEVMIELPEIAMNVTKAEVLLVVHIVRTWMEATYNPASLTHISLLEDVFHPLGIPPQVVLQMRLSGVEMKKCCTSAVVAYSGILSSIQVTVIHMEAELAVVTPLLYGPLCTHTLHSTDFFAQVDSPNSTECKEDLVSLTFQIPKDSNMPQAPAVVCVRTQGVVGCFDPVFMSWLTYCPRTRGPVIVKSPRVDKVELKISSPSDTGEHLPQGSQSGGSNVTAPTDSQNTTQTYNQTPSSDKPTLPSHKAHVSDDHGAKAGEDGERTGCEDKPQSWGQWLATLYPLAKVVQVQVEMDSWCLFLPSKHIALVQPSMNIPFNLHGEYYARGLPNTMVITSPVVRMNSAGHKSVAPIQDIPIRAFEQSVASEKLPWSLSLSQCSAYTIIDGNTVHYVVKPSDLSATLAVTTKYHPPTSDNITSLGLCIHTDVSAIALACSQPQVQLSTKMLMDYYHTGVDLYKSLMLLEGLYNGPVAATPTHTTPPIPEHQSTPQAHKVYRAKPGLTSGSSAIEPGGSSFMSITETSDTFSLRGSPVGEVEDSDAVRLSLWMQWTMPKISAKLFSQSKQGQALSLGMETEDITFSVDLQQVYCKVKSKVGVFNLTHHILSNGVWSPGSWQGVLLTCNDQIRRPLHLAKNTHWAAPAPEKAPSSLFNMVNTEESSKARDHGFLNITFTRALRRSVKKKLKAANIDGSLDLDNTLTQGSHSRSLVYLNEVCLNVNPCDVVLNCPAIASAFSLIPLDLLNLSQRDGMPRNEQSKQDDGSGSAAPASIPLLTSSILPLLYMHIQDLRIFTPRFESVSYKPGHDTGQHSPHNVIVAQVTSLSIQPLADNPLPRIVLHQDIYDRALAAGILNHPGSEVEDRQYQVDMKGLSLATGCWLQMLSQRTSESKVSQNPALEWNTLSKPDTQVLSEPKLTPIASMFDLRVVAAPAVVYYQEDNGTVVCGHSLELNATSEVNFYLALSQVALLQQVFLTNVYPLITELTSLAAGTPASVPMSRHGSEHAARDDHMLHDSGVESEASTLITRVVIPGAVSRESTPTANTSQASPSGSQPSWISSLTPFDVLLTAGKISVMLYTHTDVTTKDAISKLSSESHHASSVTKPRTKADLNAGFPSTDLSSVPKHSSEPLLTLWPFLYLNFSQPHTVISCVPKSSQKIELSCFDMTLRGAIIGQCVEEEGKCVPDPRDYSVAWIETRAGQPHKKTGIPPCLYTFRVRDFLFQPAVIDLCLDRPLKVNLSISKLEQVLSFSDSVWQIVSSNKPAMKHTKKVAPVDKSSHKAKHSQDQGSIYVAPSYLASLTYIESIRFKTAQVIVAMETVPHPEAPMVTISSCGIEVDVSLEELLQKGALPSADGSLIVKDLQMKTSLGHKSQPLIGPLSMMVHVQSTWGPHSGASYLPRLDIYMESGIVDAFLGQEQVLCFELMSQHITDFLKNNIPVPEQEDSQSAVLVNKAPKSHDRGQHKEPINKTSDDLRNGSFNFMEGQESSIEAVPQPGEVVFGCDHQKGLGSMTWCYPEVRSLTSLHATPVPFSLPPTLINDFTKVPCIIQYYSSLTRQYHDYGEFSLSEDEACLVHLPDIHGHDVETTVAVAQVWRTVILRPDDPDTPSMRPATDDDREEQMPEMKEPLVSPLTLAAALKVNSCLLPSLIASAQGVVTVSSLQLHLYNQFTHLGQRSPARLQRFHVGEETQEDHEWLVLSLADLSVQGCSLAGRRPRLTVQVNTSIDCQIVEYRNLTMRPLLTIQDMICSLSLHSKHREQNLRCDISMNSVVFKFGQAAAYSAAVAQSAWSQLHLTEGERILPNYYIICNNTQEPVKVRQVESDEMVMVNSRHVMPYSWRSAASTQLLQVSLESMVGTWSEPISIDSLGTNIRTLEKNSQQVSVVIKVKQINNVQRQVIISGALNIASRMIQALEVKLVCSSSTLSGNIATLPPLLALPSYALPEDCVRAIRVRLAEAREATPGWSLEVPIRGEKALDCRLLKIPTQDKQSYMYAWCHIFYETHTDTVSKVTSKHCLVLFTPLFIVRTQLPRPLLMNIQTPRLKLTNQLELEGRGKEEQLHMMGGDMTHNIAFQLSEHMQPSRPLITLSSGMIEQIEQQSVDHVDIEELAYGWPVTSSPVWPYNDLNSTSPPHVMTTKPNQLQARDIVIPQQPRPVVGTPEAVTSITHSLATEDQPNIELQIKLRQRWAGFNTVLIDVVPYLLVANNTSLDLIIMDKDHKRHWALPSQDAFAPPALEGDFHLGVELNGHAYLSELVNLSPEDNSSRFLPNVEGRLYMEGCIEVNVLIKDDAEKPQLCYLSLYSTFQKGMRILTVRERFSVTNWTDMVLEIQCCTVPVMHNKVELPEANSSILISGGSSGDCQPLLLWRSLPAEDSEKLTGVNAPSHYIRLRLVNQLTHSQQTDTARAPCLWSYPMRLNMLETGARASVAIPDGMGRTSQCVTMTAQTCKTSVYLTLVEDTEPAIKLHNRCNFPLHYGQSLLSRDTRHEVTVLEEVELKNCLPTLLAHSDTYYAFPERNAHFPDMSPPANCPRLHLTGAGHESGCRVWSTAIDVQVEHSLFVHIPDFSDVKVQISHEGNTAHVYIEPVTRAEISAKEIRSRIKGVTRMERTVSLSEESHDAHASPKPESIPANNVLHAPHKAPTPTVKMYDINCLCKEAILILQDDCSVMSEVSEILCLTLDNIGGSFYPKLDISRSTSSKARYDQSLVICVEDIQVDNLMYSSKSYDFPVLFLKQPTSSSENEVSLLEEGQFSQMSVEEKLGVIMNKGILCAKVGFFNYADSSQMTVQSFSLKLTPVTVYVEDVFVFHVATKIEELLPSLAPDYEAHLDVRSNLRKLPKEVQLRAICLNRPIRLEHLCIEPINVLVSIHASLKVFLASDNTPLTFRQFERSSLYTDHHQLVRSLVMHYASGTLLHAGQVVGSLEILGNPTGLVRNLSSGVADMLRLPYQGLTVGPGAFIGGVGRGFGSLVKHVSAGTLTSITNFASSVSRNMERLSLDSEHLERQELSRKQKPTGLSQGLANGLSGFGLSLLGAVAGIADQPLQIFTKEDRSRAGTATGLLSGMGKGIMGVVTKPIGGAAELVSQTGMGLLHGAGLVTFPSPRHSAVLVSTKGFPASQLKLIQKLVPRLPLVNDVKFIKAQHITRKPDPCEVGLLLTSQVLFVVDSLGDSQQQAYSVGEVICQTHPTDPNLLIILPRASQQDDNKEPFTDWLNEVVRKEELNEAMLTAADSNTPDEDQLGGSPVRTLVQHKFSMAIHDRELFLALFIQARNEVKGYGFVV